MVSTNTSYSIHPLGYIRIRNDFTDESCDYPLYASSVVSSSIDIAPEAPVIENASYSFSVRLLSDLPVSELCISVNGSDPIVASEVQRLSSGAGSEKFSDIRVPMKQSEKHPFLLTYGFARIEVALMFRDSPEDEVVLTTKDIPCLSNEDYQTPLISQMLNELLDAEEQTVAGWMFTGCEDDGSAYSIIEAALRGSSPKSLSSVLQLMEASISEYESDYDYFHSHGFNKILHTTRRLPPREIRRAGSRELLWMAKNSHVLFETPYETSVNYLGRYYLPREVETDVRAKSYDSYENRFVMGFLEELLSKARDIRYSLKSGIASIKTLEGKLNPIVGNEYSLPALTLLRQYADRENYYIAKLQDVIGRLSRLKRKYESALPDVKAEFTRPPKRTKVFQEVKCYSRIFDLALRWLTFGDFSLARENLALHSLRLDRLYEYFVLFRLLCWFHNAGFTEDNVEEKPIMQASFSLSSRYYSAEKRVATLYKLKHDETRVWLYYQPVVYGDRREENGIPFHRLSCRCAGKARGFDGYWQPDFMLMVDRGRGEPEWHIFDAKYSKATVLWRGYPKEGAFTEAVSKYKTDISSVDPVNKISSVWLFSGREASRNIQFAERSSWAAQNYVHHHSGIGALTPAFSCLDEVLSPILGMPSKVSQEGDAAFSYRKGQIAEKSSDDLSSVSIIDTYPKVTMHRMRHRSVNRCLPLIIELFNIVENGELLFKSHWSEVNLGLAHPLLRKSSPKGREYKHYTKTEINGVTCYAYNNWLPNYENKLRSFIERHRHSL